jgi:hypothetical protein
VFVVKNAPIYESNFVFATLMPLTSSQLNASQQSKEDVQRTNQIEKGRASTNCDTASLIHARKSNIDMSVAGMFPPPNIST